jgi:hypothetical protein
MVFLDARRVAVTQAIITMLLFASSTCSAEIPSSGPANSAPASARLGPVILTPSSAACRQGGKPKTCEIGDTLFVSFTNTPGKISGISSRHFAR